MDKIPIPTDNIFKFYALFGLLLFVFCGSAIIYMEHSTNELGFRGMVEYAAIKQISNPSPVDQAKMNSLEKRIQIAVADDKFYSSAIGSFLVISIILICYGFWKWHRDVQPIQDDMVRLQIEKLRYEVQQLKNCTHSNKKVTPVAHSK